MNEADWARIAIEIVIALGSGAASAIGTAYTMGQRGVEERAKLKEEFRLEIDTLRKEVVDGMSETVTAADARNDLLIEQIKETLEGIRRQHDDHKLHVETYFSRKEAMESFMKVYREDQNRINDKLDRLLASRA